MCKECRAYDKKAILLSTSSVYTLQYIISRDVERLFNFRVSGQVLKELKACARSYLKHYLNHEFKSTELLGSL